MSTKSSLALSEWKEKRYVHIYREMQDGKYYIETETGTLEIPEKHAKAFASVIPDNISKEFVKEEKL